MEVIANGGYNGNIIDTMDAILLTKNIKYIDGILVDVRKTLDNVLVLSKYNDLKKNTLSNKLISETNYNYIRKIKFPSHIFKYYIPKLSEFLEKYNNHKKIFLRLYDIDNNYLNLLYNVIIKYHYNYYYIIEEDIEKFMNHDIFKIGKICTNYVFVDKIPYNNNEEEDIYLIVKNINKIYKTTLFDNFFS